jgi:hypothetical protein
MSARNAPKSRVCIPAAGQETEIARLSRELHDALASSLMRANAIKAEADNGSFYVSVRDTGPGISAASCFRSSSRPTTRSRARRAAPAWARHIEAHH